MSDRNNLPFVFVLAFCVPNVLSAGGERVPEEAARVAAVTASAQQFESAEPFEARPGGATTVPARLDERAFEQPAATVPESRELDFVLGRGLFKKIWVSAPSSTLASDGLGPLYNARSCLRCHIHNGRGHTPGEDADSRVSMVLKLSIPTKEAATDIEEWIATAPDPVYGGQLQDFALAGQPAEGRLEIVYDETSVTLSGGESVFLRRPTYSVADLGYGPLHEQAMLSARLAPPLVGLGLIEAVPAEDILANVDPDDLNGDGISGRAAWVPSRESNATVLGRFGWKAGSPTVRQQSAEAFSNDIGISSPVLPAHWGDCSSAQMDCRQSHDGGDVGQGGFEIDGPALDLVTYYTANLGVPERRRLDAEQTLRGKAVFYQTGCSSCHVPKFVTARQPDMQETSFQLIWPYSDFLLHDMGEGLADGRPEGRATGREWRTTPLWGIGLTKQVSERATFLHDGRARSLIEAILWHGGEAARHRDAVIAMPKPDRDALIAFLESL